MDPIKLGSGDTEVDQVLPYKCVNQLSSIDKEDEKESPICANIQPKDSNKNVEQSEITAQMIDDNEVKLKVRIAQCRNIIESLKMELNEEKTKLEDQHKCSKPEEKYKLETQSKPYKSRFVESPTKCTTSHYVSASNTYFDNISHTSGIYSDCVDSKLNCDENLAEYEKQLQKYQNTLNMAQIEKKNAIRKQMLAKAYRLKLLEVENQCNIELLRVKQSLQCLEPLQLIASKWKTSADNNFDVNNYELIPRNPELIPTSNSDFNDSRHTLDIKAPEDCDISTVDSVLLD